MIFGSVTGTIAQVVPTGYIVITGDTPTWARIILGMWLCLWAVVTVSMATVKQVKG